MDHPATAALLHLVSDLKQTAASRRLIFEGSPAQRSQLANAIASQLGHQIRHFAAQLDGLAEAENALRQLIPAAEQKHWILFFDEAGSLFAKRSSVKDAHDRFANIEVSFGGLIILGVDRTGDLPPAISQRFKTISVAAHWPPR
jgi:hypothetical protein